ncbi:hypothetical protein C8F01DRAFT_1377208 [Mycena amicta]|nr:hypothetical protein C8F01DRAFT_1377208 [Mycena amicta]
MSTDEHDEQPTATVFGTIQSLSSTRKANLLLDTALALINAGQYGPEVENYIEVYLRTPYLPRKDVVRALLARGSARKAGGECLIAKAEQDAEASGAWRLSHAFRSVTIKNLTHLDLVDTRISQLVLARIAQAHGLQSLTLHGSFEAPGAATVVFATDVLSPSDDGAGARNPPSDDAGPRTAIVEDGGKTDELGYRALTLLLPREFTAEMFASSVEGAGGTLGHVAALIARHIEVFGPRISRRVPGPERLMPIGIHLGVGARWRTDCSGCAGRWICARMLPAKTRTLVHIYDVQAVQRGYTALESVRRQIVRRAA